MTRAIVKVEPAAIVPLADLVTRINEEHRRYENANRKAMEHAVRVGELLAEVKNQLPHGEWIPWVEANCEFDVRSAQRYVRVARFIPQLPANATHVSYLPLRDIIKLERLKPEERDRVIEVVETERLDSVDAAIVAHRSAEIGRRREKAAKTYPSGGNILTGDMSLLEKAVPDDSVDLFFTDPTYLEGTIGVYGGLAKLARAKLKPGGLCLAYVGNMFLAQALDEMRKHLDYLWLCGMRHTGAAARIFKYKILVRWRPVLVMVKPPQSEACGWVMDFIDGSGRDKRFHEWGQSAREAAYWIEKLTLPGGLVVDPFCGGGTIPMACKLTGRQWLATEIDPEVAADARKRLAEVTEVAVA